MPRLAPIRAVTLAVLTAAVLGVPAAAAHAADPSVPSLAVSALGVSRFEGHLVAPATHSIGVEARVAGAAPGSTLLVTFQRGKTIIKTARFGAGEPRTITARLRPALAGRLTVSAVLQDAARVPVTPGGQVLNLTILEPRAGDGAEGMHVRFLQHRLRAMHYAAGVTGRYDLRTAYAVLAFRKVHRLPRLFTASPTVFRDVAEARDGGYRVRYPGHGRHLEGDLLRQVLVLVNPGGRIFRIYHTSSGRPGLRSPPGLWRIYAKEPGLNSHGQYYSAYYTHATGHRPACAIHGYFVVPVIAQSHCCFRVPLADARFVYNWVRRGERFDVYRARS